MEIKHFRLIKAIQEEGNLANSAEKLFLTQSALSHQLRDLELQLGFKIFYRRRHNWKLTDEGQAIYRLSIKVLDQIEKGFDVIDKLKKGASGTIRLSTECYSFYHGLSSLIQKMGYLYPDISVNFNLDATHQPVDKLLSHDIDAALVTQKPNNKELEASFIQEDELFVLMHQENPFSQQEFLEAQDFADLPLIIHSFPLETVSLYTHYLKPHHIEPVKISAIPLTEVALEMVAANLGVLCMPKWALTSFKLTDEILYKRIGQNGLKRKHYLIYRKADASKKFIREFIASLMEEFIS
ncbi:LysR family transcriptional regulator [Aquimarina brevivitae]|uniref:LysR family transcriptional regulator for metE and metH n=1 Tax=Aquimarina brevivitae TaxID=323412 RepID=A0A4Q7P3X8_9FLAO|nr:LysR family transcriptional regulator [Aquimarina brevivitae]RZS93392.1 LysR family transcriptional regulator for metE and metH [Aquimarina brevivitae]